MEEHLMVMKLMWKMKHTSNMARPRFEPKCYRYVASHANTAKPQQEITIFSRNSYNQNR